MTYVIGADESGWGSVAGPLVVGVTAMPRDYTVKHLNDSKKLSRKRREEVDLTLRTDPVVRFHLGVVTAAEINEHGPGWAYWKGYQRALGPVLDAYPQAVVHLDGEEQGLRSVLNYLGTLRRHVLHQHKADQVLACVMAASVVAKVHHDKLMEAIHERYPVYEFTKNQGYGTAAHVDKLSTHGPCPEHRRMYGPVRRCLAQQYDANKTTLAEVPDPALG